MRRDLRSVKRMLGEWIDEQLLRAKLDRQGDKIVSRWNAHMYSQNFEDSIVAEILARIGEGSRTFIEIGVESGEECNTRLLLQLGWRGLWIEASPRHVARARTVFASEIAAGRLKIVEARVTRENVQDHIAAAGFAGDLDFLSLDVDHNTSHIWRGISTRPRFACVEYNGNLPPTLPFEAEYDPLAVWNGDCNYSASLKSLELIGKEKGLALVGCDLFGVNAFFVRDELTADRFLAPFTAETHWEPLRLGLIKRQGHARP